MVSVDVKATLRRGRWQRRWTAARRKERVPLQWRNQFWQSLEDARCRKPTLGVWVCRVWPTPSSSWSAAEVCSWISDALAQASLPLWPRQWLLYQSPKYGSGTAWRTFPASSLWPHRRPFGGSLLLLLLLFFLLLLLLLLRPHRCLVRCPRSCHTSVAQGFRPGRWASRCWLGWRIRLDFPLILSSPILAGLQQTQTWSPEALVVTFVKKKKKKKISLGAR